MTITCRAAARGRRWASATTWRMVVLGQRGPAASHDVEVGVGAGQRTAAGGADAAAPGRAQQRGREAVRRRQPAVALGPRGADRRGPGSPRPLSARPPHRPVRRCPRRARATGAPRSSAVLRCLPQTRAHGVDDMRRDGVDVAGAVDDEPAAGLGRRLRGEPLAHPAANSGPSRSIAVRACGRRAAATSTGTSTKTERSAPTPAVAHATTSARPAASEAAPIALVRDGRARVAVGDHPRAGRQRGLDHLRHVLGPVGRHQQRLGPRRRRRRIGSGVEEQAAQLRAERRRPGLVGQAARRAPRPPPSPGWTCRTRRSPRAR